MNRMWVLRMVLCTCFGKVESPGKGPTTNALYVRIIKQSYLRRLRLYVFVWTLSKNTWCVIKIACKHIKYAANWVSFDARNSAQSRDQRQVKSRLIIVSENSELKTLRIYCFNIKSFVKSKQRPSTKDKVLHNHYLEILNKLFCPGQKRTLYNDSIIRWDIEPSHLIRMMELGNCPAN